MRGMFAIAALTVAACGSGEAPPDGQKASSLCARETRADVFSVGLEKSDGPVTIRIVDGEPSPPLKGTNTWVLELDVSGRPTESATITATPFMPDHGHGTSVRAVVTPRGAGRYEVSPLYFFMAGLWRTTVEVEAPGLAERHSVQIFVCVDG